MPDETYIDVPRVQRVTQTVADAVTEFANAFNTLKHTLEQHDGCWGNDTIGKSIAKNYVPNAGKTRDAASTAVDNINTGTDALRKAGAQFQDVDSINARPF